MLTALIIGAGSNKEVNSDIGLGIDLITDISNRVTDRTVSPSEAVLSKALEKACNELTQDVREQFVIHLDQFIATYPNPSIDAFMYEVASYP
ncbi:MAG: hypothetical protein C0490_18780, partial [Marivirga sp.]|nr:hypothetical protein [Marivirga sp.]